MNTNPINSPKATAISAPRTEDEAAEFADNGRNTGGKSYFRPGNAQGAARDIANQQNVITPKTVAEALEHVSEAVAALRRLPTQSPTYEEAIRALEDIALLDEADGHLLKWEHASRAVAIATSTLNKHPSQIHSERQQTAPGQAFGRPITQPPARSKELQEWIASYPGDPEALQDALAEIETTQSPPANPTNAETKRERLIAAIVLQLDMAHDREIIELNAQEIADIVISQTSNLPTQSPDVKSPETAGALLHRLGDDAAKWAAEFRPTAIRLGYSDMDEGWLIGWFASAIEHSSAIRRDRLPTQSPLSQGGGDECRFSWNGHVVRGDHASIKAVGIAVHEASTIPAFRQRISELSKPAGAEAVANVLETVSVVLLHAADILDDHGNVYADTVRSVQQQVLAALRSPALPAPDAETIAFNPDSYSIADLVANIPAPTSKQVEVGELALDEFYNGTKDADVAGAVANVYRAMKALEPRSPAMPAPAQGVTVTEETVERAMLAVQKSCDITPREMRRALQAALHPAEPEKGDPL